MTHASVKKCVFITTSCAILLSSTVELTGIPDGIGLWKGIFLPGISTASAAAPADMGRNDPGVQLNQAREYLERQAVARQMEEDQARQKAQVEMEAQKPDESTAKVSFTLEKVEIDSSEVLSAEELNKITEHYMGKTVTLQDLYAITGAINNLYSDKGFMVCRAYLPPQRIHGGVVQIKLLEGKTGMVTLQGLKHTREKYVTARVPLKPGIVANTANLNKQLQRFNGTNDVQLRVLVHAGKEPGTTDYEIVAYEPKQNQNVTVFLDNNGYETSGRFRQGLYYNIRSLTGMRDSLRLNYLRSEGTNLYGLGYSVPVSKMGTRLDIDYSTNTTKIIKGEAKPLDVKGDAYAMGLTIRHPLRVDQKRRDEVGLQFMNQKSKTKWRSIDYWTEDKRNQKKYRHGQMFSARLDGQLAGDKDRSSADRFYLGGTSSVRGYEESFIGGNKGAALGLTYQVPLDKKQRFNAFTFFDYGWVSDDIDLNASSYSAYSTGLGLSASVKNVYASMTLGIPLKRDYEFTTKKVSNTRFDFVMSATF